MDLGLERIKIALEAMGNPCADIPAIQIVGTNGKGSIASFMQSSLKTAGIKTGVTTSPHLVDWCERICINGESISHEEFLNRLHSFQPIAKKYRLTAFEIVIAIAFDHFASNNVELMVLEVGLGGRLDATTAHPLRPIIAVAGIGMDHSEHLGKNIQAIAKEKASVISKGSKVISAKQDPDVAKVLEDVSALQNARLEWVAPLSKDWKLGLNGNIQRENAAVAKRALEALEEFGWKLKEQTIRNGFNLAKWPGRLQRINWKGLPLVIDGAHNPHAAKQLSKERSFWHGEEKGIHWILAIQINKEAPEMIRELLKPKDIAWVVPVPKCPSWTKSKLSMKCPELSEQIIEEQGIEKVLYRLTKEREWPSPPPVIAGSLFIIGDLIKMKGIK